MSTRVFLNMPLFLCVGLLGITNHPSLAMARVQPTTTTTPSQDRSFLGDQLRRYRGVLLAQGNPPLYGRKPVRFTNPHSPSRYDLRDMPLQKLEEDLYKVKNSIRKYKELNRPYAPSRQAPLILLSISCAGALAGVTALVVAYTALPAVLPGIFALLLTAGVAFTVGIIWFAIANSKYRRSPYYNKIQTLKGIQKAIKMELRSRSRRWFRGRTSASAGRLMALHF